MRLMAVTLTAWLAAIVAHLLPPQLLWQERFSVEDLLGIVLMSAAYSLGVFFLLYLPGLFWLRRRLGGCKPKVFFPLAAASILNISVALGVGLRHQFGGAFSPGEAVLFIVQFIVAGLIFGAGFVKVYAKRPFHKATSDFA